MSDSLASAKRTRSQLALPDDILHIPERSPMKDARIALRLHGTEAAGSHYIEESDDELLLSPRKANASQQRVSSKRSASPSSRDEYRSRSASPSDRRAPKRLKRDADFEQDAPCCPQGIATLDPQIPSAHSRSASQPIIVNSHSGDLGQSSGSRANLFSGKDRARSVPIFPSSSFAPHIDLRNPPPSPWRARSLSPSKEREMKLRITSGPTQAAKLETITDGSALEIHTAATIAPSAGTPRLLTTTSRNISPSPDTNLDTTPDKGEVTNDNHTSSMSILHEPPSTPPTTQPLSLTFPLSPLTPLPPTPLPASIDVNPSRYATTGWTFGSNREDTDEPLQEFKLLPAGTTKQSRLPRPSSTKNSSSVQPPSPSATLDAEGTTQMGHPPSSKQSLSVGTTSRLPTNERQSSPKPSIVNAFTVLMGNAIKGKRTDQPKGKAKERPSSSKGRGSSSLAVIAPKQKGRNEDKRTLSQPKISIKAKMRPKEKHTPKPKPTSAPVDVADEHKAHRPASDVFTPMNVSTSSHLPGTISEDQPMEAACATDSDIVAPSSRMHSPVHTPQPVPAFRRTDVPMEPTSGAQSDVAHLPAFSKVLTPTPREDSTPTESHPPRPSLIKSELCNETSSVGVALLDRHLEEPSVNTPLASRAPVSKLPLVKRVRPITTTTDRVTRRMSQRQREKQAESSSQALRNTSPQQRTNPKNPISTMASDFKEETASSSEVYPQDIDSSMSSLSDVATDPDPEEEISPGSPMKLSSPLLKASESAFSRPTRSSAMKTVLSKTPTKAKLPLKLTSPSPARLVRSASVSSTRPPGGLTRTFTGFGSNQGSSSLSTLANALEKLRMPAPERPNTSMGFNRELAVDRDLETTKYSTDDLSTGSTMLERTASLESAESGTGDAHSHGASAEYGPSRSEQKSSSLITRERVGRANLYSGSGSIMRGGKSMRALQHKPRNFGIGLFGSGRASKVSRKTSLPSVTASPIKGNGTVDVTEEAEVYSSDLDAARPNHADTLSVSSLAVDGEVRSLSRKSPSRRVSLASQALSQSLSSLPLKQTQVMGPPTTPPNRRPGLRSSSSSYPSSTSSATSEMVAPGSIPSANGKSNGSAGSQITSGKSAEHIAASSNTIPESLKILHDCVIFVDVRTDDGDEAGSLFVEMLEGVGAKILTRVGQTCSHIVYKNGLMSTLTRYRLLRDPKPLVVGIAWVVECVEQRQRVDESKFLVNLDGVNVAGTNKRRRSMLPKLIRREAEVTRSSDVERNRQGIEHDQSMDGSSSLMIMDEELTPLELARRRKTGMRTP